MKFNEKEFIERVKRKLYQLKRSKRWARKIDRELDSVNTPEQAKDYIKKAGQCSVEEIKKENSR